jgi:hypothetical protein
MEQTPEEPSSEETPAPVAETVSEPDQVDPVQQYLAKYDGDTNKALAAAAEAQSLIGRQGNELGEIRQQLQQLTNAVAPQEPEQQWVPVDDSLVSWATDIGSSPNFHEGALWALQHQPAIYDSIMEQAYAVDPMAAGRFESNLRAQASQQQFEQRLAPIIEPLMQQKTQGEVERAFVNVRNQYPDLSELTPRMLEIGQQYPEVLAVLQSGSPDAQERVISLLYGAAKGLNVAPLQGAANQAAANAADGAAALRTQAAVGTTTNSAPPVTADTDDPNYEWRQAFAEEASRL